MKELQPEPYSDLKLESKVGSGIWRDTQKCFDEVDLNGDGKIDFDEFRIHMMGLIRLGCYKNRRGANEDESPETLDVYNPKSTLLIDVENKDLNQSIVADFQYKVIVIGDVAVGKTSLLHRMETGKFKDQKATVGFGHATFEKKLANKKKVKLKVWDTAGSEAFSSLPQ